MGRHSVLITNIKLAERSGTEVVTCEIAQGLARRGHDVRVYAPLIGASGQALRRSGVAVVDSLADDHPPPDVIHGHHNVTTATAIARYPATPAVFVCHDATIWHDTAPRLPAIRCYLAVDERCRARLARELAVPAATIELMPNAVDLDRFTRRAPLPARPLRALVLSKNAGHLPAVRAACARAGIALDELGPGVGRVVDDLPRVLADYDLVFAAARMAIESIASGIAVIVCDERGLAGLARAADFAEWRTRNFGVDLMTRAVTVDDLAAEIACYDPADAAALTTLLRGQASLEHALDAWETHYRAVIESTRTAPIDAAAATAALVDFMAEWLPSYARRGPFVSQAVATALSARQAAADAQAASAAKDVILRSPSKLFRAWLRLLVGKTTLR